MTDGYVERRRQYVADIRKSFYEEGDSKVESRQEENLQTMGAVFVKIRFFLALFAFAAFLYCQYTGTEILGYKTSKIVEMVTDNHYYTNLKNYVMIQEHHF